MQSERTGTIEFRGTGEKMPDDDGKQDRSKPIWGAKLSIE